MNRTDMLQRSITALFRSGADADHSAEEMEELLDGIDFNLLLQAVLELREPVYFRLKQSAYSDVSLSRSVFFEAVCVRLAAT